MAVDKDLLERELSLRIELLNHVADVQRDVPARESLSDSLVRDAGYRPMDLRPAAPEGTRLKVRKSDMRSWEFMKRHTHTIMQAQKRGLLDVIDG